MYKNNFKKRGEGDIMHQLILNNNQKLIIDFITFRIPNNYIHFFKIESRFV